MKPSRRHWALSAQNSPFIPKALQEGDVSGIEGEAQAVPNPDLPPAGGDVPLPVVAHPAPKLAPSVQADLARSVRTASNVDRVSQLLKGNRLCQENPALCSKAVQEMAGQGDMHTLYVPRDAFEQVAQSSGVASESLLQRMPETQANGGLLAIPAQEYFTVLPEGMAGDLSPFVKIDPAKGSLAEVLARAKRDPAGADGMDAEAPPDSQKAATAERDADAANAKRWDDTHPPLPPEQIKVPGGGLRAHEATGGHALGRHVGQDINELLNRFTEKRYKKLKNSSSFTDEATAEEAIAAALAAHEQEINAWLATKEEKFDGATATFKKPIGIIASNGAKIGVPAHGVQVVLKRDPLSKLGYFILTGYPTR